MYVADRGAAAGGVSCRVCTGRSGAVWHSAIDDQPRDVVEQAIIHVNAILPADMDVRLRLTWPASGYFPRLYFEADRTAPGFTIELVTDQIFNNGWRFRNAKEIPVYVVDNARLGRVENVFVPEGERCIFVTGRSLDRMFESIFLVGENALQQHASYDKSLAATWRGMSINGTNSRHLNTPCRSNPESILRRSQATAASSTTS